MIPGNRGGQLPRRVLIGAAIALAGLLSGCGIGNSAQTQQWHQPTDGSTASAAGGAITIDNAFVLGAAPDATVPAGQNAGLFLAIYNSGPADRLTAISTPAASSVRLPGRSVSIKSRQAALLTGPRPALVLMRLTRPLIGGSTITITLKFSTAGQVSMTVPVMPSAQYYQTFSPAPSTARPGSGARPSLAG